MTTQLRAIRRAIDAGLDAVAALRDAERMTIRKPDTEDGHDRVMRCLIVANDSALVLRDEMRRLVQQAAMRGERHHG